MRSINHQGYHACCRDTGLSRPIPRPLDLIHTSTLLNDRRKVTSQGQALIEAILVIAFVAMMSFALFTLFLAGPIQEILGDARQSVVDMIGGTRGGAGTLTAEVTQFPRDWYRPRYLQDTGPADLGPDRSITGGGEIQGGGEIEGDGIVRGGGNIAGGVIPDPPPITGGTVQGGGDIAGGEVSGGGVGGGDIGGGILGGADGDRSAQGGRSGSGGDDSSGQKAADADGDSKRRGTGGAGGGDLGTDASGQIDRRGRKGGDEVEVVYDEEKGEWVRKPSDEAGEEAQSGDDRGDGEAGRKAAGAGKEKDPAGIEEKTGFDWMTVLRIAILVLLLIFILYIAVGSTRRRRNQ